MIVKISGDDSTVFTFLLAREIMGMSVMEIKFLHIRPCLFIRSAFQTSEYGGNLDSLLSDVLSIVHGR